MTKEKNLNEEIHELEEKGMRSFFDHIEFLEFNDNEKEAVAADITESSKGGSLYWWQVALSAIIGTFGLLNSATVILAAMLIAPLNKPINGIGYGIARGSNKVFFGALRVLIISVFFSIFIGYIVTKFTGLSIETEAILSGVNPNIIDFFIAIFASIIAVLGIRYKKFGDSGVAGVALSVALLLPLITIGIEVAIGNFSNALGAFMLFATNLLAVLIVGIIFFWIYGFVPYGIKMQAKSFKRLGIISLLIILIIIPLLFSFNILKSNSETVLKVESYLADTVSGNPDLTISNVEVLSDNSSGLRVGIAIRIPEGYDVSIVSEQILAALEAKFNKQVTLELEIVRFTTVEVK